MSGGDNVFINVRERPLSSDVNNLQSMGARSLADLLQYLNAIDTLTPGQPPTNTPRAVIPGGLELVPSGGNVVVQPGVLLQYSATLAPTPGSLDSSYRMGILRTATSVTLGFAGGATFYLIEAQVVQVTTQSLNVDILDPGTGNFVPALDPKQYEFQVQFQATSGATVPAFSGGDWVPIAVVQRPGGGGSVANTDIIDMRPMLANRFAKNNETPVTDGEGYGVSRGDGWMYAPDDLTNTADTAFVLNAEAYLPTGERVWYAGKVADTAPFIESGLTFTAGHWYYVYLSGFRNTGSPPVNVYNGATWTGSTKHGNGRGLVIVSAVAPDGLGANSGSIQPAAPWSTSSAIAAGFARCVAAVRRNAGNNGWEPIWSADGREFCVGGTINQVIASSLPASGSNNITPAANSLPTGIKSWKGWLQLIGANAGPNEFDVYVAPTGATTPHLTPTFILDEAAATLAGGGAEFDIPVLGLSTTALFNLHVAVGGAINGATRWTMILTSFRF